MSEVVKVKLGDVIEVKYGKDHKSLSDGNIPIYGSGGIMRFGDKALYDKKSILIPRKGSLNNIFYKDEPFWTVDTMFWSKIDEAKVFPKFLFYQLTTVDYSNLNVGSAVPSLTVPVIEAIDISLPPISEQTAIASILTSLDDKIDLLHRQNKTLEHLAETMFRQWFVVEAEESSVVKLGNVIKTSSGGTPSRSKMEYFHNGTVKWVKSKELQGSYIFDTEEKITDEAVKNSSAKLFPANTILIAMYGATVGEYAILAEPATCNQAICGLIPNDNFPYTFLFILTKYNKENLIGLAGGSAQQNISQELIKDIEIPNSVDKIKEFHRIAETYFDKIKSNQTQIRTLTQTRDTLLPKLMSGEVRVEM